MGDRKKPLEPISYLDIKEWIWNQTDMKSAEFAKIFYKKEDVDGLVKELQKWRNER